MGFLPDWLQQLADECPDEEARRLAEQLEEAPEEKDENNSPQGVT